VLSRLWCAACITQAACRTASITDVQGQLSLLHGVAGILRISMRDINKVGNKILQEGSKDTINILKHSPASKYIRQRNNLSKPVRDNRKSTKWTDRGQDNLYNQNFKN
jgi:hypothetical protein